MIEIPINPWAPDFPIRIITIDAKALTGVATAINPVKLFVGGWAVRLLALILALVILAVPTAH
jgi:hypothetical protein